VVKFEAARGLSVCIVVSSALQVDDRGRGKEFKMVDHGDWLDWMSWKELGAQLHNVLVLKATVPDTANALPASDEWLLCCKLTGGYNDALLLLDHFVSVNHPRG